MEQNAKKKIPCGGFMLGEGLVLSEDGKTLSVSGGGERYFNVNVVNLSPDEQGFGYLTLDATNEQIYAAYESGKHVFINILGQANAQVQKGPDGSLYAIVFMPRTTGISGLTKLSVYFLESMNPKWKMSVSYISTTKE